LGRRRKKVVLNEPIAAYGGFMTNPKSALPFFHLRAALLWTTKNPSAVFLP